MPVLPALGGKLKSTAATLRSARSLRRRSTSLPTRAASASARSVQVCMSWSCSACLKVQLRSQPWQAAPAASLRPPKTIGPVQPSSSGMAIIIVASTGSRPRSEPPQDSSVWNSTGVTAR